MPKFLIDNVGSLGDGMGQLNGETVYVATTLPGEQVEAEGEPPHLVLQEVISPSPDRIEPICPHFGACGGCSLQHMAREKMLQWKRAEVATAFSRAGINVETEACIASSTNSRRRVTFTARRNAGNVELGFNQRASSELVNITQCPILLPEIESELQTFVKLAATLLRGNEDIQIAINACDNGLDLNFLLEADPSEDMLAGFVRAFSKTHYLRAAINSAVVVEKEKPIVSFDGIAVAIQPGGFLQAVVSAENAMAKLVTDHLKSSKRVVDLFSGNGTFSLRFAKNSHVHAVETDAPALAALTKASGGKLKPVTIQQRDLDQLPLMASELKPFDGLCLDPPRAGAAPQIREIAKANIRSMAYVSCNPTTLARDAKTLMQAGYKLRRVVPIDQFVFSPHIEVVALFSKKPTKAARSIFR